MGGTEAEEKTGLGVLKLAWFRMLKISVRNWTLRACYRENATELSRTRFLAMVIFAFLACAGCGCASRVIETVRAPRGFLQAIIFTRDCGATTSFSTHISIVGSMNSEPWGRREVFIADHDHGKVGLGSRNELSVDVSWIDASTLLIIYPRHARVFKRESKVHGISVEYKPRD